MKIYCITHKPIDGIKSLNLIPFGVGKTKFPSNYVIENNGDNIAHKNYNYSETSFHYWYWKKINKDPQKKQVDYVDWVELIKFRETRNYVQRVMENYNVYRYILEQRPVPMKNFFKDQPLF